jgi:hypothetical protein
MLRYIRKPLPIRAVVFTGHNQGMIKAAFGAEIKEHGLPFEPGYFYLETSTGVKGVWAGYWITQAPDGTIGVMRPKDFEAEYEAAPREGTCRPRP